MNTTQKTKLSSLTNTIWQVGSHRLACGSADDPELIRKLCGHEKIRSVICDVPYGINYTESKEGFSDITVKKAIANDNITDEDDYTLFNEKWLSIILPYLTRENSIYVFNCDKMIFALRKSFDLLKIRFCQLLIWVKNQPVIGRLRYLPQHELILYGWYGKQRFVRGKDKSVLFYPRPSKSSFHATQKPIALIKNLVRNSTRVGEIVFDGFLGSGTTALACEETRRICYGCEIDTEHFQNILKRFEMRYGIQATCIERHEENK
ncbi:MAG TPA: site-specific DNA-methyltransferase [Candidatus Paceibacterota bacterium]|nr:site-specific DNA-methyltransferase [Candidatus Paceibacterota bacterium]